MSNVYYSEWQKQYVGYGDFTCSLCGKDVFIQYDAHEIPSTGDIVTHKNKPYCLCNKCLSKCIKAGLNELLDNCKPLTEGQL